MTYALMCPIGFLGGVVFFYLFQKCKSSGTSRNQYFGSEGGEHTFEDKSRTIDWHSMSTRGSINKSFEYSPLRDESA